MINLKEVLGAVRFRRGVLTLKEYEMVMKALKQYREANNYDGRKSPQAKADTLVGSDL